MFDQGKFDQCFFIVSDCLCAKLYDITFFAGAKWWYEAVWVNIWGIIGPAAWQGSIEDPYMIIGN